MNKITHKRSSVAGKKPTATDLEVGEIGLNLADAKIYTKNTGGTIIELGASSGGGGTTLPADAAGVLTNDGTGGLSWGASAVASVTWGAITGKPTTTAGYGITDALTLGTTSTDAAAGNHVHAVADITGLIAALAGKEDSLPADAAGALTNDGSGVLSWVVPAAPTAPAWSTITGTPTTLAGYGITDAAAATHTHAMADVTGLTAALAAKQDNLPADAVGMLRNDGSGVLSWFPMPSSGMNFVGGIDPASMPSSPKAGDFIIFTKAGTVGGVTAKTGDMGVYSGTKWDVIENAQDLSAYITKPTTDAVGYLHRDGAGKYIWSNPPAPTWASVTGKPATFPPTIGVTAATAAAGNHNHDTRYLRLSGGTVTALTTFSGAANANIRLSDAAFHNAQVIGTDAQGDLVKRTTIPWSMISGKPTIPAATAAPVGSTNQFAYFSATNTVHGTAAVTMASAKRIIIAATYKLGVGVAPTQSIQSQANIYSGAAIMAKGDITAFYSDRRLKTDFEPLSRPLDKIKSLEAFTYTPNDQARTVGAVQPQDNKRRVGVGAQDVQAVLPEAVSRAPFDWADEVGEESLSGEDYLTVDYSKLVPLLIAGIQELSDKVAVLEGK